MQCCEVTELIFAGQPCDPPGATLPAALGHQPAGRQGGCLPSGQLHDPQLTVAQLASKYTYTSRGSVPRVQEYTLESIHGYLTNLRMQHCRNAADGTGVLDACTASGLQITAAF